MRNVEKESGKYVNYDGIWLFISVRVTRLITFCYLLKNTQMADVIVNRMYKA